MATTISSADALQNSATNAEPPASLKSAISQKAIFAAVFAATAAAMLFFNWHLRFDLGDDAYIHLRIAQNLVHTGHPYFNPGEPVMVTSSPVWTLFLALSETLFGARNMLWAWNAIFVAVAAALSYRLAWFHVGSLSKTDQVAALILPLTTMACLSTSYSGMETALAIVLLLLAAVGFLQSSVWALPVLTLAAFTRYELAVVLAVAGAVCLLTRTALRHGAIPAAAIVGVFTAWLWKEFGTIIPNAVVAKSRVYSLPTSVIADNLLPRPFLPADFRNPLFMVGLVLFVLWLVDVVKHPEHREPIRLAALALLFWGICLILLYIGGKTFIFPWYVPLVTCPILAGTLLMAMIDRSNARRITALALLSALFLNVYLAPARVAAASLADRPEGAPLLNESRRVHLYLDAGALLYQACPHSELMTSEIGGLGYSFKGYISDGVGIASPGAIKYHPMAVPLERSDPGLGAIPPRFVWDRRPDLIFSFDIYAEAVTASPQIHAAYDDLRFHPVLKSEMAANLPPIWGSKVLHVFVKKGGGCPAPQVSQALSAILTPIN